MVYRAVRQATELYDPTALRSLILVRTFIHFSSISSQNIFFSLPMRSGSMISTRTGCFVFFFFLSFFSLIRLTFHLSKHLKLSSIFFYYLWDRLRAKANFEKYFCFLSFFSSFLFAIEDPPHADGIYLKERAASCRICHSMYAASETRGGRPVGALFRTELIRVSNMAWCYRSWYGTCDNIHLSN